MNETKTILVTSHDHDQFALAVSLFERDAYRVIFEHDVQRSVRIAKAERPNLIISELAVPDIDGPRFCRRLREIRMLEDIPIVLVGDLSPQSFIVRDSLRSGASNYLQRPFDQIALFELCSDVESVGKAGIYRSFVNSSRPDTVLEHFGPWTVAQDLICSN